MEGAQLQFVPDAEFSTRPALCRAELRSLPARVAWRNAWRSGEARALLSSIGAASAKVAGIQQQGARNRTRAACAFRQHAREDGAQVRYSYLDLKARARELDKQLPGIRHRAGRRTFRARLAREVFPPGSVSKTSAVQTRKNLREKGEWESS